MPLQAPLGEGGVRCDLEVETTDKTGVAGESKRLYFASIRDYERLQQDTLQPIQVSPVQPEEIVYVESLAS